MLICTLNNCACKHHKKKKFKKKEEEEESIACEHTVVEISLRRRSVKTDGNNALIFIGRLTKAKHACKTFNYSFHKFLLKMIIQKT